MDIDITSYLLGKSQGGSAGTGVKLTVNPSTTDTTYTPEAGTYYNEVEALGVTSSIDANITASNIKNGVSILGVTGNLVVQDWSTIGYSSQPQFITDGYNYALTVKQNWDATRYSINYLYRSDKKLIFMPDVNMSSVGYMNNTFDSCYLLTTVPALNTSNVESMQGTFVNCRSLYSLGLIDTSSVTNMNACFKGCESLETIPALNTSNVTNMGYLFSECSSLKNVPLLATSKVTNFNNMFLQASQVLTDTSLNNILLMCKNATSYAGNKTLGWLGFSGAYVASSRWQACPNYQDFLDAGWTIGY